MPDQSNREIIIGLVFLVVSTGGLILFLDWEIRRLRARLFKSEFENTKDQDAKDVHRLSDTDLHNEINNDLGGNNTRKS